MLGLTMPLVPDVRAAFVRVCNSRAGHLAANAAARYGSRFLDLDGLTRMLGEVKTAYIQAAVRDGVTEADATAQANGYMEAWIQATEVERVLPRRTYERFKNELLSESSQ
jgi:hypothetical protein